LVDGQLTRLFGPPRQHYSHRMNGHVPTCAFTGATTWRKAQAWYLRGRFVGFSYEGQLAHLRNGSSAVLRTNAGLRPRDTLTRATRLYGHPPEVSSAQGGSWLIYTKAGPLLGYAQPGMHLEWVSSIEAGRIGCGALAPQPLANPHGPFHA
jgi:hypothetical protein